MLASSFHFPSARFEWSPLPNHFVHALKMRSGKIAISRCIDWA